MNIPAIARSIGTEILISSHNGRMALRIVNSIVPVDLRLDADVATGNDLDRLLGNLTDDLYMVIVRIDVPVDGRFTAFPTTIMVSVLGCVLLVTLLIVGNFVLTAAHLGLLESSSWLKGISAWLR